MGLLKSIGFLPEISDTERIALQAGTKWIDGEYFSGRRFNDNGDVAIRIAGAIVRQAQEEYIYSNMGRNSMSSEETLPLLEGIISAWFDTLSASEIDILIIDGLKCCAETDHWYEFEKQWD